MKTKTKIAGAVSALALVFTLIGAPTAYADNIDRMIVDSLHYNGSPASMDVCAHLMDGTTDTFYGCFPFSIENITTHQGLMNAANLVLTNYATLIEAPMTYGIIWPQLSQSQIQTLIDNSITSHTATSSALSLSLQTSTGAVGTQVSTTTGSWVSVAGQVSVTSTIAGSSAGDIVVEVAPTNSATSSDWVEWGRIGTSQAFSLAVALQGVQVVKGQVMAWVPKNWYVKARSVGSGTFTNTLNTVKKVLQ